jgi:hypothetical protein
MLRPRTQGIMMYTCCLLPGLFAQVDDITAAQAAFEARAGGTGSKSSDEIWRPQDATH